MTDEFNLIPSPDTPGVLPYSRAGRQDGPLDNSLLKRIADALEWMNAPRKIYHGKFISAIANEEFPFKYDILMFKRITFVTGAANAGHAHIGGHSVDLSNSPALPSSSAVTFECVNSADLSVIITDAGDIVYWIGEA